MMRVFMGVLIWTMLLCAGDLTYYRIVIGSYAQSDNAESTKEHLVRALQHDEAFVHLQKAIGFEFEVYKGSKYFTLSLKPFAHEADVKAVLERIHKIDKAPYVGRYTVPQPIKSVAVSSAAVSSLNATLETNASSSEVAHSQQALSSDRKASEASVASAVSSATQSAVLVVQTASDRISHATSSSVSPAQPNVTKEPPMLATTTTASGGAWWLYILVTVLAVLALFLWWRNRALVFRGHQLEKQLAHQGSDAISKEAFLSRMSHEIRTPMNAIIGFSHVLLESKLDAMQTQYVQNVQNAAGLLLSIVNDVLDYSKLEAGHVTLENHQFNINAMLDTISVRFTQKASQKGLEFIFEIHNNVPSRMVGDEGKLEAVLNNLLGNAIKFTSKGEVVLRIKRLSSAEGQIQLEFKVCDTGIGIHAKQLEVLFDSFRQADSSKSRSFEGMGLGLSICKEYVGMMGGVIDVKSAPEKGSCFTFTVLFDTPEQIELRNYRLPDRSIMNKRVLVVDNNTTAAGALQRMIAYYHYHADIVASEDEAIRVLKNCEYDIICLDSKLLESENADTIQHFKEHTNAKIVLLENNVIHALGGTISGVDAELKKPFSQQDLFNTIINLYSERSTPQEQTQSSGVKERLKMFEGRKILLAEDNAINQNVIFSLLKESGIRLIIANNGQEAVELLEQHPDVGMIFMDISMPVMDGYEAARAIRSKPVFASIPIVALTANIQPSDVRQSLEAGMQEHIGKPFNVGAFYEAILKYMGSEALRVSQPPQKPVVTLMGEEVLMRERGMELVGGDRALYEELLGEFVEMFGGTVQSLHTLLEEGSFEAGVKLIHDIKGVSANLGAMKLHQAAQELEGVFKQSNEELAAKTLERYSEVHQSTIAAMRA